MTGISFTNHEIPITPLSQKGRLLLPLVKGGGEGFGCNQLSNDLLKSRQGRAVFRALLVGI